MWPVVFDRGNAALRGMRSMQAIQAGNQQLAAGNRAADTEAGVDTAIRDWLGGRDALGAPASPAAAAPAPTPPVAAAPAPLPSQPGAVPALPQPSAFRAVTGAPPAAPAAAPSMLPQAPDYSSLTARLARVPGAGRLALQVKQNQDTLATNLRSKSLDQAFAALKSGNVPAFQFWSGQAGVSWPDEVLADERGRAELARAGEWKKLYGNDLTGFGRFFQEAMRGASATGAPDWRRAFAMHPPQRPVSAAEISAGLGSPAMRDARILAKAKGIPLDQAYSLVQQGHFRPQQAPGQVQLFNARRDAWLRAHPGDEQGALTYAGGGGARGGSGRQSVYEIKQQAWLAAHPGDAQGALDYAGGRKTMSDAELRLASTRIAAGLAKGSLVPPSTEDVLTQAGQIFDGLKASQGVGTVAPGAATDLPAAGGAPDETPDPEASAPIGTGSFGPDLSGYEHPQTKEDYDALSSGDYYVDPDDGQLYQKP
jgi:hypothetical protein